jgi:hypothetical protein
VTFPFTTLGSEDTKAGTLAIARKYPRPTPAHPRQRLQGGTGSPELARSRLFSFSSSRERWSIKMHGHDFFDAIG